jgi:nitrogen regulatory protein P-II 1
VNQVLRWYREDNMKKIEAIIRPAKAGDVYDALEAVGCLDIMFSEIGDRRKQKSVEQGFREKMYYRTASLTKAKLEIVANDSDVEKIVKAICTVAMTGKAGDGRVLVYDITDTMRISTGVWEKTIG